jgi:hypothetical protein
MVTSRRIILSRFSCDAGNSAAFHRIPRRLSFVKDQLIPRRIRTTDQQRGVNVDLKNCLCGHISYGHPMTPRRTMVRRPRGVAAEGDRGSKKCAFHGERKSTRGPALIVVMPGACLDGPCTRRACTGFLRAGATWRPGRWLLRPPPRMRRWPKEHQASGFAPSATDLSTLSERSGPEPVAGSSRYRRAMGSCAARRRPGAGRCGTCPDASGSGSRAAT